MQNYFKSYSNFTEGVYFAYWWSCIAKGLRAGCDAGLFNHKADFKTDPATLGLLKASGPKHQQGEIISYQIPTDYNHILPDIS